MTPQNAINDVREEIYDFESELEQHKEEENDALKNHNKFSEKVSKKVDRFFLTVYETAQRLQIWCSEQRGAGC